MNEPFVPRVLPDNPADADGDAIWLAVSDLGRHFRRLEDDYQSGDPERVGLRARAIVTLADRVGLRCVARVAADVVRCTLTGDGAALSATLSRLMRLLSQSLDDLSRHSGPP